MIHTQLSEKFTFEGKEYIKLVIDQRSKIHTLINADNQGTV